MTYRPKRPVLTSDERKEKEARDVRVRQIIDEMNNRPPSILEVVIKGFQVFIGWHK